MEIKLDKIYESQRSENQDIVDFDKNHKKRPSWVKADLDKKIIFIKILVDGEAFWYRRYFENFYFIFEPTSEDYKNYYNEIADKYEQYVPYNKKLVGKLLNFFNELNIRKSAKILDVGSGTGIVTEGIVKGGYSNITLLDLSENELNIAKAKGILKNANYQNIDLTQEDIEGKFDLIFGTMSLEYFKGEKMVGVLKKIHNALSEKGKVIVIDRHIYSEFNEFFKEIENGKFELETPDGTYDYFYYVGEKK
ncbi:methyltransferase domain-containing protein [archaeon]|jgi:ubiquinone/menaquinone biosynthesis C-methylase UbiE|nr:methyltransferase domain-containing protein [archaeon]